MTATDGSECREKPSEYYFHLDFSNGEKMVLRFDHYAKRLEGVIYPSISPKEGEDCRLVSFKRIDESDLIKILKEGIESAIELKYAQSTLVKSITARDTAYTACKKKTERMRKIIL